MRAVLLIYLVMWSSVTLAQDHFSGGIASNRVGVLNASLNPAELANLSSKVDIHLYAVSATVANNKFKSNELGEENEFQTLLFQGASPVNLRINLELMGPSVGFKANDWGFAFTTKVNGKFDLVDIDVNFGDALRNGGINAVFNSTTLNGNFKQRLTLATYGELGFSVAKNLWDIEKYKINVGTTIKLIFPGSYANFGATETNGNITTVAGNSFLSNTNTQINIAYSGNLANNFLETETYTNSIFGALNGFGVDLGMNFMILDNFNTKNYVFNSGLAIRNLGSMQFNDPANLSKNYSLVIPATERLNLNQFEGSTSLKEIEQLLLDSGFLTTTGHTRRFKVNLPTVVNAYADVRLFRTVYTSFFWQQKLNNDRLNYQITAANSFTITPRLSLNHFELFSPWSHHEISNISGGLGLRFGGFLVGSGSVITTLLNKSKHTDFYFGFRFGIGKI